MVSSDHLRSLIAAELESLTALRHDLHAHPEIGLNEHRTAKVISRELRAAGVPFCDGLAGGTGVIAHLAGAASHAMALRADIDALPITEATGLPYASTIPGVMHACGHDGHTTILIGAARILSAISKKQTLPRPVTFLFQPAEESLGGATRMIADGCLRGRMGPAVNEIFGLHGWPWLPVHSIGVRDGALLASTDSFCIRVAGRGAHAAWPHLAHDPVLALASIVTALQTIVSRNIDPVHAVVVSVCVVRAGSAFNVIAEEGLLEGTLRTLCQDDRMLSMKRIEEIAHHAARMHGCEATVEFMRGCPTTINEPTATARVRAAAQSIPDAQLVEVLQPFMGGEDFACYGAQVPASFFLIGLQDPSGSPLPPLHHPTFDFNDSALAVGVEAMCRLALGEPHA